MRRFGRPVGNTDSLSFLYYNDTRNRREEEEERRRYGGHNHTSYNGYASPDSKPVEVESLNLYATDNATNHRTEKYEQVSMASFAEYYF